MVINNKWNKNQIPTFFNLTDWGCLFSWCLFCPHFLRLLLKCSQPTQLHLPRKREGPSRPHRPKRSTRRWHSTEAWANRLPVWSFWKWVWGWVLWYSVFEWRDSLEIIGNRYYGLCFSLMQIETAVPNTMAEAFATVHGQPDTYGCCVCIMQ